MYKIVSERGLIVSRCYMGQAEAYRVRDQWERNYPQIGKLSVVKG